MRKIVSLLIALSIICGYAAAPLMAEQSQPVTTQELVVVEVYSPQTEELLEEEVIVEEVPIVVIEETIIEPIIIEQYPEARQIWDTLTSWGWSAETAAGIIGNMMAEIGGGTLDLSRWNSDKGCGYGLCQWTAGRASGIKNRYGTYPNIDQQLQYMRDELLGENGVRSQVSEYERAQILQGQSPEQVAYAFASYFERCGVNYRARRQGYARIAYDYFMANS